jgi:hypothetical protein
VNLLRIVFWFYTIYYPYCFKDSFELGDKYASFAIAYCYHSGCDDFDINLDKAIYNDL